MKQPTSRFLCLLLTPCLLLTGMPVQAVSLPEAETAAAAQSTSLPEETLTVKEEAEAEPLDRGKILQLVDAQEFEANNFTRRLTDEEHLNTYVFQKPTGEKTVYFFDENVKYEKDGQILEKDLTLTEKTGGYGIVQNEVDLLMSNDPAKGIYVHYEAATLRMVPQGLASGIRAQADGNAVIYEDAYGQGIDLKYTPLMSGVKEDIILSEYVENASYEFILTAEGVSAYNDSEGWYLAETPASDPLLRIGNTLVYDAMGKPCDGTLTVESLGGGKYRLTVGAPGSFLSDLETVYPVTIDPTVTFAGQDSIDDATVYEGYSTRNYGTATSNRVGTYNDTYGVGRTLIKLNGLINSDIYQDIAAGQIKSVLLYMNGISSSSGALPQTIKAYPNTEIWYENTVTWNSKPNYNGSLYPIHPIIGCPGFSIANE